MKRAVFTGVSVLVSITAVTQFRHRQRKQVTYDRVVTELEANTSNDKVTVLVTGGRGVLGRALIKSLVQDGGYDVHCLDLCLPDANSRVSGVSSYIATDITNKDQFKQAVRDTKPKAVFHTAALLPRIEFSTSNIRRVNFEGTKNVVSTCKELGVHRLIYTSSISVYMDKHTLDIGVVTEDNPIPPTSIDTYSESKKLADRAVLEANGDNFSTCSLRLTSFMSNESILLRNLRQGRMFYMGDGTVRLPISDIDYLTKAHILAEKKLRSGSSSIASGKAYNITGDSPMTKDLYSYNHNPNSDVTMYSHAKPISMPAIGMYALCLANVALYHTIGYTFSPMFIPTSLKYMQCSLEISGEKARRELELEMNEPWQKTMEKYAAMRK